MSVSSPTQYRSVGIALAVGSGLLIGTSFVFKKKGLLRSQQGHAAGEGVAYLKSPMWWTGMILMLCGETCNFGAYAFVEAIVVTPLGALSVVISAILSHVILKEKLTLFGWIGCIQCILGAILISLNAPGEQSVSTIAAFKKLFLAPGFLSYGACCIVAALIIVIFIAPKYGKKSMIWYILVCSIIGGISVSCTQGLGACILTSIRGENQFKNWFIYFLLIFVICTLLTEIYYLNVALALFNTAMVTPTYYVLFTFFTLVTSVILYQGLKASASAIITIALSFLVICTGIFILQLSKIDPRHLSRIGRRTTTLLQAAREEVRSTGDVLTGDENDAEKLLEFTEEPGMDSLAGRFSGVGGTVVRARRRSTLRRGVDGTRRRRADTTASAPCLTHVRPSMQSGFSRGVDSNDMDAEHAQHLHELWLKEWQEKKRGEEGEALVQVFTADSRFDGNEREPVEGLPIATGSKSPGAYMNGGHVHSAASIGIVPSNEKLLSSPAGTPSSDLHSAHSVHFSDRPERHSPTQSADAIPHQTSLTSQTATAMPASPLPALIPRWNTSLPSLHLPMHMPAFLSRGASSNSHPSPIMENGAQEKDG